eukprot:6176925-Pleurochrysis_carterae.AAC.1
MCDAAVSPAMGLKTHDEENPTWVQAMKGDEEHHWRDTSRTAMHNFSRHGVYVEISDDQLPSRNPNTKRAFEVIDMMWVLKKKRDEKGGLLKYKARPVVCGNQQKSKVLNSGTKHSLETFTPAARSATFKLLCAVGCISNLRVKIFDVDAACLQGQFEGDDGEVHVRPPPGERFFNHRGVPIV